MTLRLVHIPYLAPHATDGTHAICEEVLGLVVVVAFFSFAITFLPNDVMSLNTRVRVCGTEAHKPRKTICEVGHNDFNALVFSPGVNIFPILSHWALQQLKWLCVYFCCAILLCNFVVRLALAWTENIYYLLCRVYKLFVVLLLVGNWAEVS